MARARAQVYENELKLTQVLSSAPEVRVRHKLNRRGKLALAGLLLLGGLVSVGPFLSLYSPLDQDVTRRLEGFSLEHPLGTDQFGRDILARLLTGGRWSLLGAVVVCAGTSLLGFTIGAIAEFGNRIIDGVLQRLIEALLALPGIVMALALSAVLGRNFSELLLALIVTNWAWYARTYRALILKERVATYIEGAQVVGASPLRLLFRHILPNIAGPALVIATLNFGAVILNLSALSFIGLGMQQPTPEWGTMINEARPYFQRYPWQMIAPGLCIAVTVLLVNLLGDALRDYLDPRNDTV
jgi:ABC-type dipeptide/oligopeptide/nickel transport system permease subunit